MCPAPFHSDRSRPRTRLRSLARVHRTWQYSATVTTNSNRDADTPWHLKGNWAPVRDEIDAHDLPVEGEIPRALDGSYYRNGMNPRSGYSESWFFGHGMVNRIELTRCLLQSNLFYGGADDWSAPDCFAPAGAYLDACLRLKQALEAMGKREVVLSMALYKQRRPGYPQGIEALELTYQAIARAGVSSICGWSAIATIPY